VGSKKKAKRIGIRVVGCVLGDANSVRASMFIVGMLKERVDRSNTRIYV